MAEVLSPPAQRDGMSYFGGSSLQRSSSHSSLLLQNPSYQGCPGSLDAGYPHTSYDSRPSNSLPSSAPSSPLYSQPQFSNQPSYTSTPSSSLSLDDHCPLIHEDISFPSYGNDELPDSSEQTCPPTSPEETPIPIETYVDSESSPLTSSNVQRVGPLQRAGDDMEIKPEPTRHVDYLSHNWKEEDVWSSWRYVVSRRKHFSNSSRLENASWRTWTKAKYQLRTVSPETLNWMKDHDVTWLYGPLLTYAGNLLSSSSAPAVSSLSRSSSFASKKPILKKRSLSEVMLQKSISSSTLIQQATDALRAQQPDRRPGDRPVLSARMFSDSTTASSLEGARSESDESHSSASQSTSTSGQQTPCTRKHIHFNNKVEQCIAINGEHDHCRFHKTVQDDSDSDSDDELLTMKSVPSKARLSNQSTPRTSFSSESKTIAMLPSTTLKFRGDTPDPGRQQEKQKSGFRSFGLKLPSSPSQETIRPSNRSNNFLLNDEDEDMDMNWQPSTGRRDSIFVHSSQRTGSYYNKDQDLESSGLRRTPSGMFMPYEGDEGDSNSSGIFGKVVDTVNTARDIAHVIWNVGWRA